MSTFRYPAVKALEFAFIVECAAVAMAYFVGGTPPVVAVLIVGPLLLAPISRQVAVRLEKRPDSTELESIFGRLNLLSATVVFVVGAILGGLGTNVVSHSSVGWRYFVVVVSGVLWLMVAAAAVRRNAKP